MTIAYMSQTHLRIRTFFLGFAEIADGIVKLITLGKGMKTSFAWMLIEWDTRRWLKKIRQKGNTVGEVRKA